MKNTLEHKSYFYSQYYGQRVLYIIGGSKDINPISHWNTIQTRDHFVDTYLLLKDISLITDEELKVIEEFTGNRIQRAEFKYSIFTQSIFTAEFAISYLRSKGYALPYLGLSVEKQIEYGWVKLKEK